MTDKATRAELKIEDMRFVDFDSPSFQEKYQRDVVDRNKELMEKTKINWENMNVKYY